MNHRAAFLGLALTLLSLPCLADKCATLEQAIAAAPHRMDALKTSRMSMPDAFDTKWQWDPTNDTCYVAAMTPQEQLVSCTSPANDGSAALVAAKAAMNDVQACLDRSGRKYRTRDWGSHVADKRGVRENGAFLLPVPSDDRYGTIIESEASCTPDNVCTWGMSVRYAFMH